MKRWLVLLLLLIQTVFAVGAEAAIQVPPKPSTASGIYVQDYAGVLSPQTRQALNAIGQDLDNKTTAQVAVVTVKTIDGQPIDEYGLTCCGNGALAIKKRINGALILVAVLMTDNHGSRSATAWKASCGRYDRTDPRPADAALLQAGSIRKRHRAGLPGRGDYRSQQLQRQAGRSTL